MLTFDGVEVPDIPAGLPTADSVKLKLGAGGMLELRGEKIAVRPATGVHLHVADFNWD